MQVVEFSRWHYMLRRSLFHHDLIVHWFPYVLVRLWIMLSPFILERGRMQRRWERALLSLVRKSFLQLEREGGLKPIAIYSSDGGKKVEISVDEPRAQRDALNRLL